MSLYNNDSHVQLKNNFLNHLVLDNEYFRKEFYHLNQLPDQTNFPWCCWGNGYVRIFFVVSMTLSVSLHFQWKG